MMASNDKLTAGNSRSKQFTGSPVVFAPAHSVGPEPAALPSQTPNIKNEIFRAIVDQAVVGFAQADLEGRITFVNDRYCEITGYTREELLGKQWLELTHPDDRPQNIEYLEQMKRDDKPYSFEKRYLRKNGEIIWVNIGASQQHNADGQKFGGATFVIDITERKAAEKTWHESEEKLRGLYELSPLGIALTDLQGRYIEFNEAFKKICGYPEDELKTLDYWQLTPKKYAVDEARQLESLERTGHYGPYEKEYIRKDGSLVPIQLNGMLLTGSDRQKYIWSIVQDITERKHAETEIIRANNQLQATLDAIPDLVFELGLGGSYLSIHASRPELLVVPAEEMIGKTVHDILPPDATDVVMLALREANETGRSYGRQIKLQVPQGTLWFEFSIARKSVLAGEQPCFVVLSHDITERKKTTEWLRKSLEEIEDLYNHAACGYHSLDKDGTIRRINDTELAWLGYTRDEVIGKMKWPDLLTSASQKIFKKDYPRLMKQGHINNIEVEIIRRDGTIFNGLINASAIYDTSGDYVMNRATVFDITERTRLERETIELRDEMAELQKLHVAAQTAAAFAHELNQPLLAIASYSKAALMLLQAGKPDLDKARLAIEGSERQAHRAGQAIREMLEFLSLKEFSTEAFDLTKETIAAVNVAKLEYELKLHPVFRIINEIPLIQANRTHLQRVLHNLLHNCTEAMREAGVLTPSIIVTMRSIKDENVVQMTIQDNGPGFKKENIQHLFEPFFTTKTRGIGLGLAISRSLIEANGGQLWVDLQEGSGAIFHLTLPIAT